jgi:hypothetical protein
MCGECLRTCAYDNVTIRWRPFAREIQVRSAGEAWLAMSMFVLATAYCIVHLGHWSGLRDYVNILDKANYGLFAVFAFVLWLFALGIVPGTMLALAAVGKRLAGLSVSAFATMKASTTALIPSGLSVWMAFVVPMLTVNVTFVLQSFSDPFGWGWNLLGEASTPWHQLWPSAVPWIQVSVILAGLGYSLRNAWRAWFELTLEPRAALRGMLPLAGFLVLYTGGMVWFFAN